MRSHMEKIKSGMPLKELKDENDFLGLKDKAEQITDFIKNYYYEAKTIENSMMVLYGNWGSGKTSIMESIKNNISDGDGLKTVFFNAWEFEKDGNLALSLFDAIIEQKKGEFDDKRLNFIKDFIKRVHLNSISIPIKGIGVGFSIDKKITSAYKALEIFKTEIIKFENELLKEDNKSKLVVFIDDLDRCEPENVLSLLSFIKLFFTYTNRTLYFCGIDKKAVENSVKIKYGDVIKSEEYLEKIFDISFNMPKYFDIKKMINYYLKEENGIKEDKEIDLIVNFFEAIEFTNARHLKKLLNKYRILKYTKENNLFGSELIPDLDNVINVIFVLYFIVLYDFFPKEFDRLEDYEGRMEVFKGAFKEEYVLLKNINVISNLKFSDFSIENDKENSFNNVNRVITFFLKDREVSKELSEPDLNMAIQKYIEGDKCVLKRFIKFIYKENLRYNLKGITGSNINIFTKYVNKNSDYKFINLVKMAKTVL